MEICLEICLENGYVSAKIGTVGISGMGFGVPDRFSYSSLTQVVDSISCSQLHIAFLYFS